MIKNYLKLAFRNLYRNKAHSMINIVGLSVGLVSSILIMMFIWHELSYDNFHPDVENTYRIYLHKPKDFYMKSNSYNIVPGMLQPEIKLRYPEVKFASRLVIHNDVISIGGHKFDNETLYFVDQDFYNIFNIKMIYGSKEHVIEDNFSVLLSESISKKYFGDRNPVGQIMKFSDTLNIVVKGVFRDLSSKSHLDIKILLPFPVLVLNKSENNFETWKQNSCRTYIQLDDRISKSAFESKLIDLIKEKTDEDTEDRYLLQSVRDIHLYGKINFEISTNGDVKYILIFGAVALFLLLIAAFNYTNLATARALKRAKEVGIRKVFGANYKQLFWQFIGESLLISFISLIFALILIEIFESHFNSFVDRDISFYSLPLYFFVLVFGAVIIVGFISGSYPALYLSRFSPIRVMKGNIRNSSKSIVISNIIVLLQFIISVVLIICNLVIQSQLKFINNKKLGYDSQNVLWVELNSKELVEKQEVLKNTLLSYPGVEEITVSGFLPSKITNRSRFKYGDGTGNEFTMFNSRVKYNFLSFYNIKLIKGENFVENMLPEKFIIINEVAAEVLKSAMGVDNVIGKKIGLNPFTIIGIVENFHFASLNQKIHPVCLVLSSKEFTRKMSVRINENMLDETIAFIESKVTELSPKHPFKYSMLKDTIDSSYQDEYRLSRLFTFFTVLAIIIACLGLYGIISFITEQRTKEIGIRKTYGASVKDIIRLLSKNVSRWVLVANVIAWPVAWYFMDKWLQNFEYRIELGIGVFLLAGVLTFFIAFLTSFFHSMKAALANPVESIKYE